MWWVKWIFRATNVVVLVVLLMLLDAQGAGLIVRGSWEYKDLIAIRLSVVAIIVTFIGIIVAVAAIWGFQSLKVMAEEKAIETSKVGSAAYLQSGEFKADLRTQIEAAIQNAAKEAVQDALTPMLLKADVAPEFQVEDQEWRD
jgi:hypothetical protein